MSENNEQPTAGGTRTRSPQAQEPSASGGVARLPRRRVSDVVDNGLWPDLPQRNNADLIGVDFVISDFKILHSQEYDNDYAVMKCADAGDGEEFTSLCGGGVVVDKLRTLRAQNALPIIASLTEVKAKRGGRDYFDII